MTVAELIRILRNHPDDMRVVVNGYEEGFDDLEADLIHVRELRMNAGEKWWEGRHRELWDKRAEGNAIVEALVLPRPTKDG